MFNLMKKSNLLYILVLALIPAFSACGEKSKNDKSEEEEVVYLSASNTAVTSFSLRSDTTYKNLDKVFFTIDLVGKRIFNADSLPVGTNVSKLRVDIGYPTEAKEVIIRMREREEKEDAEVKYSDTPYDSIDFTGKVYIKVVAQNGKDSTIYDVKLNVHTMKPDSMFWDKLAVRQLPAQASPVEQKTVSHEGLVYTLIKTTSGYQVSTIANPASSDWTEKTVQFGFTPRINTFVASSDAFYILSDAGKLYTSPDAISWNVAPGSTKSFYNLYGGYDNMVLACARESENDFYHAYVYSAADGDKDLGQMPVRMPVDGFSQLVNYDSEVALSSQVILVGGADMFGEYTTACWGFDGNRWAQISVSELPGMYGAMLFPYKTFRVSEALVATEYNVLMAIGGKDENDQANKRVFYSYDNGVYWVEGSELMQLPGYFPAAIGAQAIIADIKYTRASNDTDWNLMPSIKLPVWCNPIPNGTHLTRSGYTITWDCPYIYVFGGTDLSGNLNNSIWRGVLNRLSFKPLI